jgi:transposase
VKELKRLSSNQDIIECLNATNKKLDVIIVILLVNSGMKLPDIAKTIGVSVRTIQRMIPIAKLKCSKGKKPQLEVEEISEPSENDETQNNNT